MNKILSPWSKKVKKAMIDRDMDTNDLARMLGYTRQYTSSIINGVVYYEEPVVRISDTFSIPIPPNGGTLAYRTIADRNGRNIKKPECEVTYEQNY